MSIANHLLAGSVIGLLIHKPLLAVVLAFASHFAMDALPHFGYTGNNKFFNAAKGIVIPKVMYAYVLASALAFVAIVISLILSQSYFVLVVGLAAVLPDAVTTLHYLAFEKKGRQLTGSFMWLTLKFHRDIQYERPWGIFAEIITFCALLLFFLKL